MHHSPVWKKYMTRFIVRLFILAAFVLAYFFRRGWFAVLEGMNFFRRFSPLHLLWGLWMGDMVLQLIPARPHVALGSQKHLSCHYQPGQTPDADVLRAFINASDRSALRVFLIWAVLTLALGWLYHRGTLGAAELLLVSVIFFVCDLICVLFWCPFRVFLMKNRCCTTCRIFNWDHLMMFSFLVFVPGFYTLSLFGASAGVFLVWEITFHRHPERFWSRTNRALRCVSCTDRLCTHTASIDRAIK